MRSKQVFKRDNYEYNTNNGLDRIAYCPACGSRFNFKTYADAIRPVCPSCNFVYYKNPSPGVSVLIVKEDKVLLGKRAKGSFMEGKWCLPCGYIEFQEDFLTAAKREAKEETGLDIELDSIVNVNSNFLSRSIHSLVIVILAHVKNGEAKPGDDIEALLWQPLTEELPNMAFEADISIIHTYKANQIVGLPVDIGYK